MAEAKAPKTPYSVASQEAETLSFAQQVREKYTRFPGWVDSRLERFSERARILDIETGGLSPKTPIYEWGVQEGFHPKPWSIKHGLGSVAAAQNDLSLMSAFSLNKIAEREVAAPGFMQAVLAADMPQEQVAREMLAGIQGGDAWVQNLAFERRAIHERLGGAGGEFDQWARGVGQLESVSPVGGQLYTTTPKIKSAVSQASAAAYGGDTKAYLNEWENVFGAFMETLQAPVAPGTTRAFDIMDLSKSVMAMAQNRGYMPATGELFAGTSVDALGRAMFDMKELHTAGADNVMQGGIVRELLGAGMMMQADERLPVDQQLMFERLGRAQPGIKQRNAERTIANAYETDQKLKAIRENAPGSEKLDKLDLQRQMRRSYGQTSSNIPIDVRQADGSHKRQFIEQPHRTPFIPERETASNLDELIEARKADQAGQIGLKPDWDAARKSVQEKVINPHRAASANPELGRIGAFNAPEVQKGMSGLSGLSDDVMRGLEAAPVRDTARGAASWLKGNLLPVGVAAGAAIAFGAWISSDDDDYNSIEGLRHGGISGGTRKENTEFGSGYQGPNPSIRKNIRSVNIDDYMVEDADTVRVMLEGGDSVSVRLAGIDAPETTHEGSSRGRVNEDQPYGQAAATHLRNLMNSQNNLRLLVNVNAATSYGRVAGTIVGDKDGDLNRQLLSMGAAKALPFGKVKERTYDSSEYLAAEAEAAAQRRGMWENEGWSAIRQSEMGSTRKTTNTSLTQMDRMFDHFDAAAKAIRLHSKDDSLAAMQAMGGTSDHNIIEGLRHGWMGAQRSDTTDFGSGYVIDKVVRSQRLSQSIKRSLQTSHRGAVTTMKRMMQRDNMIQHHLGG